MTLDGDSLVMDNYGERKGTVVVFLSSRCDATAKALPKINRLHGQFRLRGVLFVGICPNSQESADELRTFCQRNGVVFPVYRDPDRDVSKQFGARVTPEAFLLDRKGKVFYAGSLRNLSGAITSFSSGRAVPRSRTQAEGTPIGQPGPKRELADPYGTVSFSSELVFETIPNAPAHHCSTLTQAANGDLLCLWYGGSYESADDQVLFMSRRPKGKRTWSRPTVVVRNPLQPPGNAVIFVDGLKRVWIVWGRMEASRPLRRGGGWGQCRLMYRISMDHGATWSKDQELDGLYACLPRNVPITLTDGTLLLGLTGRRGKRHGSFVLRTTDNGTIWQPSGLMQGGSQPTLIERDDGTLLALMRHAPRILQSTSRDGGRSWTPPEPSDLKNPGAGIAMTRLRSGRVVLVFNDSETLRTPLSIARSVDGGKTWERPLKLEANPGEYSYPSVIQTSDGKIHVTYTYRRYAIKHVEMSEGWLTHLKRPN
jgi:predicted neuraminidase/peroxiredoxin